MAGFSWRNATLLLFLAGTACGPTRAGIGGESGRPAAWDSPGEYLGRVNLGAPTEERMAAAGAVLGRWGWRVEEDGTALDGLRTDWRYFAGPGSGRTAGRLCGAATEVGLRLRVVRRSPQRPLVAEAQARLPRGGDSQVALAAARRTFASVAEALRRSLDDPSASAPRPPRGEIALDRDGVRWCASVGD